MSCIPSPFGGGGGGGSGDPFVGDSGSGGEQGEVPAPAAGDGVAKFLKADGTWAIPAGAGDVVGPASSTDNAVARFHLATGKIIQNSTLIVGDTGNITGAGTLNTHTIPGGTGTIALTSDIPATLTIGKSIFLAQGAFFS